MTWLSAPIRSVAQVVTGNTPPKSDEANYGSDVPWVKPPELGSTEPIVATSEMLSLQGAERARVLPKDAVLVSCIGSIGRVGIAGIPLATNQQINSVVCGPTLLPRFAMYWFMHSAEALAAAANNAVVPILNKGNFEKMPIPVWPLREQSRIVELLDEADRLRRLRREADAKAVRILPVLFLKMFGDPATNPMGWPMKPLGSLADQRPEYGANASAYPWEKDKPRYVRITDIKDDGSLSDKEVVSLDAVDWHRYLLQEGDVLFARSGNTVGKTYIYRSSDGLCSFAGYLIRFQFRSGAVDPWFIFGLTRTAYYRGWVESHKRVAGQPNINGQEYSSFLIPEPPLPMQQKFGMLTRNIESILVGAAEAAENLETTFSTMLQQAFSGQLTAKWREAHMKELLAEMEQQARLLNLPLPVEQGALA